MMFAQSQAILWLQQLASSQEIPKLDSRVADSDHCAIMKRTRFIWVDVYKDKKNNDNKVHFSSSKLFIQTGCQKLEINNKAVAFQEFHLKEWENKSQQQIKITLWQSVYFIEEVEVSPHLKLRDSTYKNSKTIVSLTTSPTLTLLSPKIDVLLGIINCFEQALVETPKLIVLWQLLWFNHGTHLSPIQALIPSPPVGWGRKLHW